MEGLIQDRTIRDQIARKNSDDRSRAAGASIGSDLLERRPQFRQIEPNVATLPGVAFYPKRHIGED